MEWNFGDSQQESSVRTETVGGGGLDVLNEVLRLGEVDIGLRQREKRNVSKFRAFNARKGEEIVTSAPNC